MGAYSEFGKRVKIAMISLNLNNRELAKMLGYKESTFCDLLKGRNRNHSRQKEISETLLSLQMIQDNNTE